MDGSGFVIYFLKLESDSEPHGVNVLCKCVAEPSCGSKFVEPCVRTFCL